MKIFVSQIYIQVGVIYPFSWQFQTWLSKELTELVQPSSKFIQKYGEDFDLIFNVSAKAGRVKAEVRGPTIFRRTKNVEFTIFLPHNGVQTSVQTEYAEPLGNLFEAMITVFERLGMDASSFVKKLRKLVEHVCSDPVMFKFV